MWEGAALPPTWREEEQALRAAPSGARPENAAMTNDYRPGIYPWAASESGQERQSRKSKALGAGPELQLGAEHPRTAARRVQPNVKPATTTSGGEPSLLGSTIGGGSGRGETPPSGGAGLQPCDDCRADR